MAAHRFVSNESKLQAENDDLRAQLTNVIGAAQNVQEVLRQLWSQHESEQLQIQQLTARLSARPYREAWMDEDSVSGDVRSASTWSQHESDQMQIQQLNAELLRVRRGKEVRSTSGGEEGRLPVEEDEASASGKWNLLAWTRGAGFHHVVTTALQKGMADQGFGNDSDAALKFIRGLRFQGEIDSLIRTEEVMGALSDLLWSATETLQSAGAATNEEIQGKFAGSIEMSYSGLDTFFGGLESVVGSPNPNLRQTMEDEHTKRADAGQEFTTRYAAPLAGPLCCCYDPPAPLPLKVVARSAPHTLSPPHSNYDVKTTSRIEWSFVVVDNATPEQLGLPRWPAESVDKLQDRDKCRCKPLLRRLVGIANQAGGRNEQLRKANQPPLEDEELIAANLYTGPVLPPRGHVMPAV